jgi:CDP-4-dehydro-6-deoxyglucose reductase, E1
MNPKINYPLASSSWNEAEVNAMQKVINTGNFTMGSSVMQFENEFADYFGSKYAIMSNSGSSANLLMIASLFFRSKNPLTVGDEVIVPSISWSTTYMPLQQYGLKVKFIDIDLNTLNFDLEKLKEAVNDRTKVIFCVNLLGNPNSFTEIKSIINDHDVIILEDNCESMGAKYNHEMAGSIGLMGSFSTFFSHHISTMEGGMTITNDEELYHIILSLRSHGWTRHLPSTNKVTGIKSNNEFEESFNFVLPGYNLRPLELSGAIGIEQLKKLDSFVTNRRSNAKIFTELFSNNSAFYIQKEIGESSWFGFSLIINPNSRLNRNVILTDLKNNGIETRPIVGGNFTKNKTIKFFNFEIFKTLTNAEIVDNYGFFVGNHHYDLSKELELLYNLLNVYK